MVISTEKTQSMVISKEPIKCKLMVNDKTIEQVMIYKYLGIETSSDRNIIKEVQAQTNKANRISGYLRDIIWRNKYMTTESKVRLYKTCVRPILTYASKTRADTRKTKRILRSTEMRILRTIRGISLRDQINSATIREECKIQDVVKWARSRRR